MVQDLFLWLFALLRSCNLLESSLPLFWAPTAPSFFDPGMFCQLYIHQKVNYKYYPFHFLHSWAKTINSSKLSGPFLSTWCAKGHCSRLLLLSFSFFPLHLFKCLSIYLHDDFTFCCRCCCSKLPLLFPF